MVQRYTEIKMCHSLLKLEPGTNPLKWETECGPQANLRKPVCYNRITRTVKCLSIRVTTPLQCRITTPLQCTIQDNQAIKLASILVDTLATWNALAAWLIIIPVPKETTSLLWPYVQRCGLLTATSTLL